MRTVLEIGSIDVSKFVNKRKYEINKKDETVSWRDANGVIHTTVIRSRISGEVELTFVTEKDHIDFVDLIHDTCIDGYWWISLYVNNTHSFETIKVRINVNTKAVFGNVIVNGAPVVSSVTLEIEEV